MIFDYILRKNCCWEETPDFLVILQVFGKYLEIVSDFYVEPTNEEFIGTFLIPKEGSSRVNQTSSKQPGPSKNGRPADTQPKPRQKFEIRTLFQRAETRNRETKVQQNKDSSVLIID